MTWSEKREFRVKKFKNDFLLVLDRVYLEEANATVWDAVGAKFVELQQI